MFRNVFLLFLFITTVSSTCTIVYGQNRLSGKFKNSASRLSNQNLICSVSYKDSIKFNAQYAKKITIQRTYYRTAIIKTSYNLILSEMAYDTNISFVDIVQKPRVEAGIDFANPVFNRITKAHHSFPLLRGLNQNISIKEESFDSTNIDLINRSFVTTLSSKETSQHATAMATFIAGAGNSAINGLGVVPAAHFTSSDYTNLLPDDDNILSKYNIHLQNHSYGVSIENYYGNEAAAYDQQVSQYPTQMHVFSIGNSGRSIPSEGTYKNLNYANISGNFKQAKNIITVTAVDTSLLVNSLNSKGPAYDGRLKPELTAYGQNGTSDAAALVTGVCSLIQEKYLQTYSALPTASMIKAILIASADDIGSQGIDYTYGYGSLNAYQAIKLIDSRYATTITLKKSETATVPIMIPASTSALRVAVSWIDPPAVVNSNEALVHDINSYLSFSGTVFQPWVLSSKPLADSLEAPPKRKADHINNVEYFTIQQPTSNQAYQLVITAPAVLTTPEQSISIAYWFEKENNFEWDYPTASDILEANKINTLFWNQNFDQVGELSYQLNDGSWKMITPSIDLSRHFHWTTPDTLAFARLKMTIGTSEYISDKFIISPQTPVSVAFSCINDFSLNWPSIAGAGAYTVYTLNNQYLEKVTDTNEAFIVLTKNAYGKYFSVAPKLGDATGLKSATIDYSNQGSFCYINFFEAIRYTSDEIRIQLKLGTLLNIDHVTIYKTSNHEKKVFLRLDALAITDLEWMDTVLVNGFMDYQAEVFLKDGTQLESDISKVLIETKNKAILFPNPAGNNAEINILSEGLGLTIKILNNVGQFLFEYDITSTLDVLNIASLQSGIFIYQLERNGKMIDSGKFIKL